jgi:hypothetical protein
VIPKAPAPEFIPATDFKIAPESESGILAD